MFHYYLLVCLIVWSDAACPTTNLLVQAERTSSTSTPTTSTPFSIAGHQHDSDGFLFRRLCFFLLPNYHHYQQEKYKNKNELNFTPPEDISRGGGGFRKAVDENVPNTTNTTSTVDSRLIVVGMIVLETNKTTTKNVHNPPKQSSGSAISSTTTNILFVPKDVSFGKPTATLKVSSRPSSSSSFDHVENAIAECLGLLCDILVIVIADGTTDDDLHNINDVLDARHGPSMTTTTNAIRQGIEQRIKSGLFNDGKGHLVIVSSNAKDTNWIQKQVNIAPFASIVPEQWNSFDFIRPSNLIVLTPNNILLNNSLDNNDNDYKTTLNTLFPSENDDDDNNELILKLFTDLIRQVIRSKLSSDDTDRTLLEELSIEYLDQEQIGNTLNDLLLLSTKESRIKSLTLEDKDWVYSSSKSVQTDEDAAKDVQNKDPNDQIQTILTTVNRQLESLETKMNELILKQSTTSPMPLLEFGKLANDIVEDADSQLSILDDNGLIPTSLRLGLMKGITSKVLQLYKDQLQALRNYYGQRYEAILDEDHQENRDSEEINREKIEQKWAIAAEHMTQGFQTAAKNAIPAKFRNIIDNSNDYNFDHLDTLQGLISDMMESTERRKDEESLADMIMNDDSHENEYGKGGINKSMNRFRRRIPKWLERIAARAFVFGVNYLQGWLAWQGIKRAALERDRQQPKFPLF